MCNYYLMTEGTAKRKEMMTKGGKHCSIKMAVSLDSWAGTGIGILLVV